MNEKEKIMKNKIETIKILLNIIEHISSSYLDDKKFDNELKIKQKQLRALISIKKTLSEIEDKTLFLSIYNHILSNDVKKILDGELNE